MRAFFVAAAWYDLGLITRCSLRRSQRPVSPGGGPKLTRPSGNRGAGAGAGFAPVPRPCASMEGARGSANTNAAAASLLRRLVLFMCRIVAEAAVLDSISGRARGSAVEHSLHTRGVGGSIPPAPTKSSLRSDLSGAAVISHGTTPLGPSAGTISLIPWTPWRGCSEVFAPSVEAILAAYNSAARTMHRGGSTGDRDS